MNRFVVTVEGFLLLVAFDEGSLILSNVPGITVLAGDIVDNVKSSGGGGEVFVQVHVG